MRALALPMAIVAAIWLAAAPVLAALAPADLARVEVAPPADARVPGDLALETSDGRSVTVNEALGGRPTLLLPIDQACRSICGPALSILSGALAETGLAPGRDFGVILVTIGRRDDAATRAFVEAQAGDQLTRGLTVFTGPPAAVAALTEAVGYRYVPDPQNEAVAHPSAFFALTPDGRVSRVLSSLALTANDLRLALVEAGEGRVGDLGDRLKLLCYGFDTVHGVYASRVRLLLQIGGGLTVLVMLAAIAWMARRRRPTTWTATGGAS